VVPPGSRQVLINPDNTVGDVADGEPIRLPDPASLFRRRSRRLSVLAEGHELQGFLRMIAAVMAAQHAALGAADWRVALQCILDEVDAAVLPEAALEARDALKAATVEQRETLADHFLAGEVAAAESARMVFVAAALQVAWTDTAARLHLASVRLNEKEPGLCPVCNSPPVAGVIGPGGTKFGHRHLHCSLCATAWRYVRVRCVHCGSTDKISYRQVAGTSSLRAECCENCHGYSKVFYVEPPPNPPPNGEGRVGVVIEPFADDLASLGLDLMVGEEGFSRVANPFVLGDGT
jgi:FdhE protein